MGLLGDTFFQNKYVQPEHLACFREINIHNVILVMFWLFTVLGFLYQWAKFSLNTLLVVYYMLNQLYDLKYFPFSLNETFV